MQGAVPQFAGTAIGAGVFLGLSHSYICFNPCTCLHCDLFLWFEAGTHQQFAMSPHHERLVLIQIYCAVQQHNIFFHCAFLLTCYD